MKGNNDLSVALRSLTHRSLPVVALALCAAVGAGRSPAYAGQQTASVPESTLPVQSATVEAGHPAGPAAPAGDVASMVATLQKQILAQQAMLQMLQKQLTAADAGHPVAAAGTADIPTGNAPATSPLSDVSPVSPDDHPVIPPAATPEVNISAALVPAPPPAQSPPAAQVSAQGASPVQQDHSVPMSVSAPPPPATVIPVTQPVPAPADMAAPAATEPAAITLATDAQRQAYASGVTVWREIENSITSQRGLGIQLDEQYVMAGLSDMSAHRSLKMSPDDITRTMSALNGDYTRLASEARAHQEEEGRSWRVAFSKEKGAYSDAGAWYRIADKGQGRHLRTTDLVVLTVVGRLPDGAVFDGSGLQGQTKTVKVGALLPAVAIGLQRVGPGGRLTVVVPPAKGYGDMGMPPSVPGGATLIFDIAVKELAGNH